MLNKIITFFLLLILCASCNRNNPVDGFTRDATGFYYKLIAIGDGNENPAKENVLVLEAVMKTQGDSVFWDTRHDASNGLFVMLNSEIISGSCKSYFLKMVEGDSVSFLMKPSVLFRDYFDTIVPDFCLKDSLVKMNVKINQIISQAEYAALIKNSQGEDVEEDTELQELQLIDCFLVQHYKSVKADRNGIYILERTYTASEKVSVGKKIKVAYQGAFLDGKLVEKSEQTLEFIYGTPDQLVKGLNIVIGTLKKGETTKIIVPSRLAFGESGSSNGSIPPYTTLVYTIKIIDIK
ncbi:MAG: FKBP-type peptidyl-prolyl cis-trans isomerase [Burkholderiales bacterium]|nr:FKBP-type peptidyl-prolyl cis-trans isomerase [Bacteroidia bacterium]